MLARSLRDYGFNLVTASDGEDGLRLVDEVAPDLILSDVRMPRLDGPTLCRRLKANPATADIPVIFLTGMPDTEQQLQAFRLGAVDYITKPYDPQVVLARVLLHLRQDGLRRNLEQRLSALERGRGGGHGHAPGEDAPTVARRIERIARHLQQHLTETITLDQLATISHSNRRTLNAEFQSAYGMPIFTWLREQRLRQAAVLLRTTDLQIVQIAHAVGFATHPGLSGAFRERYGVTPSEYRQGQAEHA